MRDVLQRSEEPADEKSSIKEHQRTEVTNDPRSLSVGFLKRTLPRRRLFSEKHISYNRSNVSGAGRIGVGSVGCLLG
jgi:hypothetical protein